MSTAVATVQHYRFRNDDGSETAATWKAAQDTPISVAIPKFSTQQLRLRLAIDQSAGYVGNFKLYVAKNGGTPYQVGAASAGLQGAVSTLITDGSNTTEQLTLPGGDSWTAQAGVVNVATAVSHSITINPAQLVELEFCLLVETTSLVNGDTLDITLQGFLAGGIVTQFGSNIRISVVVNAPTTMFGYFIAQGILYPDTPGNFELDRNEYGLRQASVPVLNGERVIITQQPQAISGRAGTEHRFVHRKAWTGTWGPNSWMPAAMYDHLSILHEANLPFWIQFDDEMNGWFDTLRCVDGAGSIWMTSKNPIVPFGQTPVNTQSHYGNLYVNGVQQTSGFTVDNEYAIVTFAAPIAVTSIVKFAYTWRCYVKIMHFDMVPIEDSVARTLYVGRVVFEQITPNYTDDPWTMTVNYTDGSVGSP